MDQNFNSGFNQVQTPYQQSVPNATAVLVLGIISIPTCCCGYGVIALICAIIALVLASSGAKAYAANPAAYTESSYKNLNAGKICAWIGLIIGILTLIICIAFIALYGFSALSNPAELQELLESFT